MNQYRVQEGDRLDMIVFRAYQSIDADVMDAVMDENKHLLSSSILKSGDVIFLPEVKVEQTEGIDNITTSKALW